MTLGLHFHACHSSHKAQTWKRCARVSGLHTHHMMTRRAKKNPKKRGLRSEQRGIIIWGKGTYLLKGGENYVKTLGSTPSQEGGCVTVAVVQSNLESDTTTRPGSRARR